MKALLGVLGIVTAGLLAYWLLIRKQVNQAVAQTGGVAPPVGPNTAGPTLCETLAPLGGAVAAGAAGAPPQAGLAAGAVGAKPICNMLSLLSKVASPLAKGIVTGAKAVETAGVAGAKAVGSTAYKVTTNAAKETVAIATAPAKAVLHPVDTAKSIVSAVAHPGDTAKSAGKTVLHAVSLGFL